MPSGPSNGPRPSDTFIASVVLIALIAGWIFSAVSVRDFTLRLDSLIAAASRWT